MDFRNLNTLLAFLILSLSSQVCNGDVLSTVDVNPIAECANVHSEEVTAAYFTNPCQLSCVLKTSGTYNHTFWDGLECDHEKICDEGDCTLVSQAKHVPNRNSPGNWGSISLMTLRARLDHETAFVSMYLNETLICNTSTFDQTGAGYIIWNQGCTADNIYWTTKFEFRLLNTEGKYFGSAAMTFFEFLVRGLNGKEISFGLNNGPMYVKVMWSSNSLLASTNTLSTGVVQTEKSSKEHHSKKSSANELYYSGSYYRYLPLQGSKSGTTDSN